MGQYGPDPSGVPDDFMCAWRQLALNYSTKLRPDSATLVFDALGLESMCPNMTRPDPRYLPRDFPPMASKEDVQRDLETPPSNAVYVDGSKGSDNAAGTVTAPLKTLAAAVAKTRSSKGALDTIIVREGVYRFTRISGPLSLTEQDSHLTIRNFANESVWLSGATLLPSLTWTRFGESTPTHMSPPQPGDNAHGCSTTSPSDPSCGCAKASSVSECASRCLGELACNSYTMHTEEHDRFRSLCCLRRDDRWSVFNGGTGHYVGRKIRGSNLWKADISSAPGIDWEYGIPELRVDGMRATQARYPNANPETEFWPIGYLTSKSGFVPKGDWREPTIAPKPNPATAVELNTTRQDWDDQFNVYTGGINGTCSIYSPPFSYWCASKFSKGCGGCFTWNIPSGLNFDAEKLPKAKNYTNMQDAQLFAWRKAHWANWMFDINEFDVEANGTGAIIVGRGGFQGARGGAGSDWFISNVLEELDHPGEFYVDKRSKTLYLVSNSSGGAPPSPDLVIEAVQQHTLVSVVGESMDKPVVGVSLQGLGFRDAAPTFMEPHGVPSGGDWALERFGSLFVERTVGLTVSKCKWTRDSGNGISINRFNHNVTVEDSAFEWMGGSAIAAWGWTDELSDGGIHGVDGTGGDFPRYTLVQRNLFREIGVWEKQSSAFFQGKTAQTTLRENVVFNLARAGFNFNDGFGGGDIVTSNVLFNTCRESSDHGPINSWDRQPFITTVLNGKPSTQMAFRHVYGNYLISNYGGSKEIDNDDGSLFWRNYDNVMVYGWSQKFKCGAIYSYGNYKIFVTVGGKFDAGCILNKQSGVYYPNLWHDDTMLVLSPSFDYRSCWGEPYDRTQVYNNSIYTKSADVQVLIAECDSKKSVDLKHWQAQGNDPGTTLTPSWPSTAQIVSGIRNTLSAYL